MSTKLDSDSFEKRGNKLVYKSPAVGRATPAIQKAMREYMNNIQSEQVLTK
jgi:hypothetical protein